MYTVYTVRYKLYMDENDMPDGQSKAAMLTRVKEMLEWEISSGTDNSYFDGIEVKVERTMTPEAVEAKFAEL